MNSIATLCFSLLLPLAFAQSGLQTCQTQQYQLRSPHQVLNISSPNYPAGYAAGSNCKFHILAPRDHAVQLNCRWEVFPNVCGTERMLISRDGDLQFRDREVLCENRIFTRQSRHRAIAFAFESRSSTTNQHGRLMCQASAVRQNCDCGWTSEMRITNGQETVPHEFPHMVALRDTTSSQRLFCGGSIVSHRHIISAAHCTDVQPDVNKIVALVGDHDLSSSVESPFAAQYRILASVRHPGYASGTANAANDIALYITRTYIEWSRGVGPICLPFRQLSQSFAYMNADVTGWGTLSFAGAKSNTLQKAQLLTMENSVCQQQYNASILSTHLCTYDFRGLGRDSCQYDSGGPVMVRQGRIFLIGVISFGRTCGLRYGIGVNTRITAQLEWMWRQMRDSSDGVCLL